MASYLLFVIDETKRPSLGRFFQLCQGSRHGWRIDDDFWRWLRERLNQGLKLEGADLRRLPRVLARGATATPPRYCASTARRARARWS
jgi:hypothetical protein